LRSVSISTSLKRRFLDKICGAVCHDILEFSARVLAIFPCGNLRFGAFPFEILLGSCERQM